MAEGKEAADNMSNFDNENIDMEQEWLKEMIEQDFERFTLPESLKSENLLHLLDDIEIEAEQENVTPIAAAPKKGKVIWLKFASAAAEGKFGKESKAVAGYSVCAAFSVQCDIVYRDAYPIRNDRYPRLSGTGSGLPGKPQRAVP